MKSLQCILDLQANSRNVEPFDYVNNLECYSAHLKIGYPQVKW